MLIISFSFITGGWYGLQYMKHYKSESSAITLHAVAFLTVFTSLIDICAIHNSFVFLIFWELMALSSFILIIFDHTKRDTLKAGINFLIQSHISILFLTAGFIWMKIKTGTFDFDAIATFNPLNRNRTALVTFYRFCYKSFVFTPGSRQTLPLRPHLR